ncbi:unnamed protein product [Nippostrongylus brasiliensis]|uniref:DUF2887 domain-containing protein n=1 Tax=Nippostrongylus brasiliensis TaxID=27835 RepID=A0A0N4XH81_NIPBR|nr:unnamed protein product [Nippostrongylus brasiliensis]
MPLKRHRRQLTYFEESFTGKEAVDFLMDLLPRLIFEGRQVDRCAEFSFLRVFVIYISSSLDGCPIRLEL